MVMDSFDWHEAGLTVGQVAERSGTAPSALRFYERQGQIRTALAEAIPDGRIPGRQEWEHLAQHLRQQLSNRIGELDSLLDALAAPNADTQPSSAAPAASSEAHPRRNTDPPQPLGRRPA